MLKTSWEKMPNRGKQTFEAYERANKHVIKQKEGVRGGQMQVWINIARNRERCVSSTLTPWGCISQVITPSQSQGGNATIQASREASMEINHRNK